MRRDLSSFFLLILSFLLCTSSAFAWTSNAELSRVENRVRSYLETYLDSDAFMVVVSPKLVNTKGRKETYSALEGREGGVQSYLPGMPGLSADPNADHVRYSTYYDVDGKLHKQAQERGPVSVHVILSKKVNAEKVRLFKRMIPMIARIDREKGDSFKLTTGRLSRDVQDQLTQHNVVDSVVKYRRELTALVLGLIAAFAILLVLHNVMSHFLPKRKVADPKPYTPAPAPPIPSKDTKLASTENDKPEDLSLEGEHHKRAPSKDELYSKDSAVYKLIQEIGEEARKHPDRLAKLLTGWIQSGELGIRNAAVLLNNFDIKTNEGIMSKMVPSDLDYLRGHIDINFDPFSQENIRVVFEARQDLMKITAQWARTAPDPELSFLSQIEDEVLLELLRGEPPRTLAIISTQVPAHRIAVCIKSLPPEQEEEFFSELCELAKVTEEERKSLSKSLQAKEKDLRLLAFTQTAKIQTLANILQHIPSSAKQEKILNRLAKVSPNITQGVREQIFLFEDVVNLPDRVLQVLLLEEDGFLISQAFSKTSSDVKMKVKGCLPKASAEIFDFEMNQGKIYPVEEIERAQHKLVETLQRLVHEKIINGEEVKSARSAPKQSHLRVA